MIDRIFPALHIMLILSILSKYIDLSAEFLNAHQARVSTRLVSAVSIRSCDWPSDCGVFLPNQKPR